MLSGVLAFGVLFAIAPQVRVLRRALRVPAHPAAVESQTLLDVETPSRIAGPVAHASVEVLDSDVVDPAAEQERAPRRRRLLPEIPSHIGFNSPVLRGFDPGRPFENPAVVDQAIEIARRVIAREGSSHRLGISTDEAPGYAADALIAFSRRVIASARDISDPSAYFAAVVRNLIRKEVRSTRLSERSGFLAYREAILSSPEDVEPFAAGLLARRLVRRTGEDPTAPEVPLDELILARIADPSDPFLSVETEGLIELIDLLVTRYSEAEQATWALFKTAGFDTAAIDWQSHGMPEELGNMRLHKLVSHLVRDLEANAE